VEGTDGALYGTTWSGGTFFGTVFVLWPHQSWFTSWVRGAAGISSLKALGAAGATFRLQSATNLAHPVWANVATNTASVIGALSFTSLTTGGPQRFYRLVTP
jgi:hypothetical protein